MISRIFFAYVNFYDVTTSRFWSKRLFFKKLVKNRVLEQLQSKNIKIRFLRGSVKQLSQNMRNCGFYIQNIKNRVLENGYKIETFEELKKRLV